MRIGRQDAAFGVFLQDEGAPRVGVHHRRGGDSSVLLVAVLLVMVAANVATNALAPRWYVPVCVVASALLILLGLLDGLSAEGLGLGRGTVLRGLVWAAVIVLVVGIGYAIAARLHRIRGAFADRRAMGASGPAMAQRVFIAIPFGTVLLEESAFRGVLFGMLSSRHGSFWAVCGTSVLFGMWHVLPARAMQTSHEAVATALGRDRRGQVLAVLATVLFTTAGGVVFAVLRLWSGSLLPPIGLHWALNGMGVAVAWWLARQTSAGSGEAGSRTVDQD
jgi:membrane protease YdiL (CAAX protease family)